MHPHDSCHVLPHVPGSTPFFTVFTTPAAGAAQVSLSLLQRFAKTSLIFCELDIHFVSFLITVVG